MMSSKQAATIIQLIDTLSQEGIPNVTFRAFELGNETLNGALNGTWELSVSVRGTVHQTYFISKRGIATLNYSQYCYSCFVRRDHIYD